MWTGRSGLVRGVAVGALVSGAFGGLSTAILDTGFSSIAAYAFGPRSIYFVSAIVSGVVLAGLVSWLIGRALAATGALDRFGAGRAARAREAHDPDPA